jgi:hypothetical protein
MKIRSSHIQPHPTNKDYQSVLHLLRKNDEHEMDFDLDDDEELEHDVSEFFDDEDEEVSLAD